MFYTFYESINHRAKPVMPSADSLFLKLESNAWGIERILYHKTNKEALTVPCSVEKNLGSG